MVCGIGIYDDNTPISGNVYYTKWQSMLTRCYDKAYQERQPSYKGVTVCEEWLTFSNFKHWMEQQDFEGLQLDKDLLSFGNKVYSPSTCCFIPAKLNTILQTKLRSNTNYNGKYRVQIKINGKTTQVGTYKTFEEASVAYNIAKAEKLDYFIATDLPDFITEAVYIYQKQLLGGVL